MPQKNPEPPIRPELVSALTGILKEHGNARCSPQVCC
jgi:hypothetical protein